MAEGLASGEHLPNEKHVLAYSQWAEGGWGCILTGNVHVDNMHIGAPKDIFVKPQISNETRQAWKLWAAACQRGGTPAIVQICHPGRQSAAGDRSFFEKTIAPSAVSFSIGPGLFDWAVRALVFGTPREMTIRDIEKVVNQFATTAKLAADSGFSGIELHAAHGYLLAQFLSPQSNLRTDEYGGTPARRAKIVIDIIKAIRKVVPASFCVGLKMNSVDVQESDDMSESLEQFRLIANEKIDFLEISGGTYEDPRMFLGGSPAADEQAVTRGSPREAFFLEFAQAVRQKFPDVVLIVTGGFRTRRGMEAALKSNSCDLVGLGRPAAAIPHLPKDLILNDEVSDEDAHMNFAKVKVPWLAKMIPLKLVGMGVESSYYGSQIRVMGNGEKPKPPPRV